ncbi:hypothetical protein [Victivallis vadensis]|nr:hypothetical protein [Victivallis vadensis]
MVAAEMAVVLHQHPEIAGDAELPVRQRKQYTACLVRQQNGTAFFFRQKYFTAADGQRKSRFPRGNINGERQRFCRRRTCGVQPVINTELILGNCADIAGDIEYNIGTAGRKFAAQFTAPAFPFWKSGGSRKLTLITALPCGAEVLKINPHRSKSHLTLGIEPERIRQHISGTGSENPCRQCDKNTTN